MNNRLQSILHATQDRKVIMENIRNDKRAYGTHIYAYFYNSLPIFWLLDVVQHLFNQQCKIQFRLCHVGHRWILW